MSPIPVVLLTGHLGSGKTTLLNHLLGLPGVREKEIALVINEFGELGVDALYDALQLRCRVFILEQGAYLDPDGLDRVAWHLLGRTPDGSLGAYLRVVDPGQKYAEPSVGRVITAPELRGCGLGRVLMHEALLRCAQTWPGQALRISAQEHLQVFYGEFGFLPVGEPYLEDDIPHIEMLRTGAVATGDPT